MPVFHRSDSAPLSAFPPMHRSYRPDTQTIFLSSEHCREDAPPENGGEPYVDRKQAALASLSRHCRRRIRRPAGGEEVGKRSFCGDGHRPPQLSPLPAAALSGGDRRAFAGRRRRADPWHPARVRELRRDAGQGHRRRSGRADRHDGPWSGTLRLSGPRDRRATRLFRPRRMGGCSARPEEDRGRDRASPPHPDRF